MIAWREKQVFVICTLLSLTIAMFFIFQQSPPEGFWENVYTHFAASWVLIWGVIVAGIIYTAFNPLQWVLMWLVTFMTAFASGSIALIYGFPWPNHDPWIHLGIVRFGYYSAGVNPYPSFHSLTAVLSEITGLTAIHWIIVISVLLPAVALGFVIILLRRLPIHDSYLQPALFALLPGIFLGFAPRPFTFAWSFVPIALFLSLRISETNAEPYRGLAIGLVLVSPLTHPQLTVYLVLLFVSGMVVAQVQNRQLLEIHSRQSWVIFGSLFVLSGILLTAYLTYYSDVGLALIQRTTTAYQAGAGPTELSQATTGTGAFAFLDSMRAAREAVTRLSYLIFLAIFVFVGTISVLRQRETDFSYSTAWVACAAIICGFFLIFVLSSALGLERLLVMTPLVAIVPIVYGFRQFPERTLPIALAILCVTAGLVTVYPSGYTGRAGISANAKQVAGTQWLVEFNDDRDIIGSSSTLWIMRGYAPRSAVWEWEYRATVPDSVQFRWQIRVDRPLYVTDGTTEAILNRTVIETSNEDLKAEYDRLRTVRNQVYTNGGTSVYNEERQINAN